MMDARRSMVNGLLEIAGQAGPNGTLVELDYLASSGVQWIDTKVSCGADVDWSVDWTLLSGSSGQTPLSARKSSAAPNTGNGLLTSSSGQWQFMRGSYTRYGSWAAGQRHTMAMSGNDCYMDGDKVAEVTYVGQTFDYAFPIQLFAMDENGVVNRKSSLRMYTATITKSGVLVRDFVPMLRLEDSKPGMYDKVSKRFFVNSGIEDDFSYYPSLPEGYRRVEYIASSGGARIDTLVPGANANLKIVSRLKYTGYSQYAALYTAYNAETANATRVILGTTDNNTVLFYMNTKASGGSSQATMAKNAWHDVVHVNSGITIDGTTTARTSGTQGTELTNTIRLFNSNALNYMVYFSRFRIYDNNVLVRDMIPCVRTSDGIPGMYDMCGSVSPTTNSSFYINFTETGSFTYPA